MKRVAGCIIRDEVWRLLLLHRNTPELRQWETPGGKAEQGETDQDAAVREAFEELGVKVAVISRLGETSFASDDMSWHYAWFEAVIVSGDTPQIGEPDKFDDIRYWDIQELEGRNDLSPNVINLLESGVL